MHNYLCWCPEVGEEEKDASTIRAFWESDAAERYAENVYDNSGGDMAVDGYNIFVKNLETSEVLQFEVIVDYDVVFNAYEATNVRPAQ